MIPQTKGKDYKKLPTSYTRNMNTKLFYTSTKYDGHYGQIHIHNDSVKFFTSGGKEFYVEPLGAELKKLNITIPTVFEYEYIHDTEGKLGDRGKAAKITTYRTEFSKGIVSVLDPKARFMIHDIIRYEVPFKYRVENHLALLSDITQHMPNLEVVEYYLLNMKDSQEFADIMVKLGYEGAMCKEANQVFTPITRTKRVNDIIKLKPRLTVDLVCIGINSGEGKYEGMIGSLILRDEDGIEVSVGSGLTDEQRRLPDDSFVGMIIEIEYERIDSTYIQPIFKWIREDKSND